MSFFQFDPVAAALSQAEVLENIFRFLPASSLTACYLVSPKWTVEATRRLEQEALIRLDSTKLEKYGVIMAMKACRLNQQTPRPHESLSFTLDYQGSLDLLSEESLPPVMEVVYPKVKRLCVKILYLENSQIKILDPNVISQLLPRFKNITHFKLVVKPPKMDWNGRAKTALTRVATLLPATPMFESLHTVEFEIALLYEILTPPTKLKTLADRIVALAGGQGHAKLRKVYTKFTNEENDPLLQISHVDNPNASKYHPGRVGCDMTTYMLDAIGVTGREEVHQVQVTFRSGAARSIEKGGFTNLRKVQIELFNSEVDHTVRVLTVMKDQLVEVSVCIYGGSRKEVEVPSMSKLERFDIWTADDLAGCRLHIVKLSNLSDAYPMLKSVGVLTRDVHIMDSHLNNVFFGEQKTRNVKKTTSWTENKTPWSPFPKLERVVICIREVDKQDRDMYARLVERVHRNGCIIEYQDYKSEGLGSKF